MISCSECKYWNDNTCSNREYVRQMGGGYCPANNRCGYYDPRKRQPMGTCLECKWWKPNKLLSSGVCKKIKAEMGDRYIHLTTEDKPNDPNIWTIETFGCVHFEQKVTGPFYVMLPCGKHSKTWKVIFGGNESNDYPILFDNELEAEKVCKWLNECWDN